MQVHGVKSGIVSASNGGCNAFDVNRSLAAGVADLSPAFSKAPLSTLALGIIATQAHGSHAGLPAKWQDFELSPAEKER